jgi:hypothetical protein
LLCWLVKQWPSKANSNNVKSLCLEGVYSEEEGLLALGTVVMLVFGTRQKRTKLFLLATVTLLFRTLLWGIAPVGAADK